MPHAQIEVQHQEARTGGPNLEARPGGAGALGARDVIQQLKGGDL